MSREYDRPGRPLAWSAKGAPSGRLSFILRRGSLRYALHAVGPGLLRPSGPSDHLPRRGEGYRHLSCTREEQALWCRIPPRRGGRSWPEAPAGKACRSGQRRGTRSGLVGRPRRDGATEPGEPSPVSGYPPQPSPQPSPLRFACRGPRAASPIRSFGPSSPARGRMARAGLLLRSHDSGRAGLRSGGEAPAFPGASNPCR
jgi:hypothetical protein